MRLADDPVGMGIDSVLVHRPLSTGPGAPAWSGIVGMRSGDRPAEAMVAESIRDEQTIDRPGEQPVQPAIGRPGEGTDEPTVHPALDDLQLGRAAERVLRLMLDDRRGTVAEISSALALPSSSTSRAVQELAARGLVIGPGGYGAKLGLGALGPAVRTYRVGLERAATARSERLQQLEEAWASVGGRWPDDGDVVLPYGDGLDPLDLLRPERSYLAAFGARTLVWEPPVMKQPDRARRGIDSRIVLAEGARLEFRMGSPLRRTSEDIATFRVVDKSGPASCSASGGACVRRGRSTRCMRER